MSFLIGDSAFLRGCGEVCVSVWDLSWVKVSCKIILDKEGEFNLGEEEEGLFELPWAICCAHFVSSRDLDFDPGGLPTVTQYYLKLVMDR